MTVVILPLTVIVIIMKSSKVRYLFLCFLNQRWVEGVVFGLSVPLCVRNAWADAFTHRLTVDFQFYIFVQTSKIKFVDNATLKHLYVHYAHV